MCRARATATKILDQQVHFGRKVQWVSATDEETLTTNIAAFVSCQQECNRGIRQHLMAFWCWCATQCPLYCTDCDVKEIVTDHIELLFDESVDDGTANNWNKYCCLM